MRIFFFLFMITIPLISSAKPLEFTCVYTNFIQQKCGYPDLETMKYKFDCHEFSDCTYYDRTDKSKYIKNEDPLHKMGGGNPTSFFMLPHFPSAIYNPSKVYCGGKLTHIKNCRIGDVITLKDNPHTGVTKIFFTEFLSWDSHTDAYGWFKSFKNRQPKKSAR